MTSDFFTFQASRKHSSYQPTSPKLRPDAPPAASRRSWRYVATQRAIRRDVAPTASPRSWKGKTCHIMLTDLIFNLMAIKLMAVKLDGREREMREECTWFGTRMHDIRDNYCILAIFFVSLHCHSSRTANGKLTTKKRTELSHVVQVRDEGPKGQKQHAPKGRSSTPWKGRSS